MGAIAVGVAGGTGSGKTTLTRALLERFGNRSTVLFMDNYYKAHVGKTFAQGAAQNFDAPEAFDVEAARAHPDAQVRRAHRARLRLHDHNRSTDTLSITPTPVLIVEGILLFAEPRISELLDIRLFVDTDADVRLLRRIRRDVVERGRSLESVEAQYLETVKPMHELHVEPSKRKADLIIPDGGHNLVALEMIIHRIDHEL